LRQCNSAGVTQLQTQQGISDINALLTIGGGGSACEPPGS